MSHQPIWHRVSTKVDETRKTLQTIVGYANAITIVDPYLDPDKPASKEFIKVLAHLLTTRPIQFQSTAVEFHVRDPSQSYDGSKCKSVETAKAEWRDCLKPLVGDDPRLRFTVRFWQERRYDAQWEKMHDRWLRTDFATVIAPSGFDVVPCKGWRRSAWGILDANAADWLFGSLNTVGNPEISSLKPCEPPLTIAAGLSG